MGCQQYHLRPGLDPVLGALKYGRTQELTPTPSDGYRPGYDIYAFPNATNRNTTAGSGLYTFKLDYVVDVILQNANTMTANTSEIHPWHLHGHDFWELGHGKGTFDPAVDYTKLNYWNPLRVTTVPIFPFGWTVLRFVGDNPGAWAFHCHIEPHFHMGMGVVFGMGVNALPEIPHENLGCGLTKNLIRS